MNMTHVRTQIVMCLIMCGIIHENRAYDITAAICRKTFIFH